MYETFSFSSQNTFLTKVMVKPLEYVPEYFKIKYYKL